MSRSTNDAPGLSLLAVAALLVVLVVAVMATPALAAKGGNGKGNAHSGIAAESSVTFVVSPSPLPPAYSGEMYTITGTGFTPGASVKFELGSSAHFVSADANGIATSVWQAWTPGMFTFLVYELGGSYVQVGSVTVDIVEQ